MELKEYIDQENLSERALASVIGISQQHLNRLIRKVSNPSLPLAKKIKEVTNGRVTIEEMLNCELPSRLSMKKRNKKVEKPT